MKLSLKVLAAAVLAACVGVAVAAEPPAARVDNAKIFPHFAVGGGWETMIILINLADDSSTDYSIGFVESNGQPTQLDYVAPDGSIGRGSLIEGRLADDASDRYILTDLPGNPRTGWIRLDYDGDNKIGGVLIFRQRVSGRPDFETAVPLTREDETTWWAPFDNTDNFATTVAMSNPSDDSTDLQLRFWDFSGDEITTKELTLQPRTSDAFSIRERYPELNGRRGQFRVQGSGGRLSSIVLRFNPDGAFNTIPVASR
jgi:hypothetical protein